MKQIPTDLVPAFFLVCALAAVLVPRGASAESRLAYPPTRTVDAKDVLHGVTVPDPYRWLEDASSPEVKAWMAAQDDLARKELGKLPVRAKLLARLKELAYVDSVSAPVRRGAFTFLERRHATKEKSVVYWKEGKSGEEKVLFDPNTWSKDGSVSLGDWQPTLGRHARRLPGEGEQLRRGDAPGHRRGDREGLRGRRHRRRQVRERLVDARRERLLLHLASDRPEDPGGRAPRIPGGPLPPARGGPEAGPRRPRAPRRPDRVRRRDRLARRPLARPLRPARVDVDGRLLPRPGGPEAGRPLDAARRRDGGALERRGLPRPVLRDDGRRRPAGAGLRSRSRAARPEGLARGRPRAPRRHDGRRGGPRGPAGAQLPEGRLFAPGGPRARRRARARGEAARPSGPSAGRRAWPTTTRRTSRSSRTRRRARSTRCR